MTFRRAALVVLILVLLAPLALAGGWQAFLRFQPDRQRYPVRGIDVSHHQGAIDWPAVAADDVAFAYLKASEGGDHRDRQFAMNWRAARQAGVRVGAYHYFTLCRPGVDQARNFLATTPPDVDALPPVVDLEFGGNCGTRPDGAALRLQLDAFLGPVEQRAGRPAVLYMTDEFRRAYGGVLPDRPQWRRSIVFKPSGRTAWTIWQFHNRGRVAGIKGPVDLNLFAGDRAAFDRWAGP
ncbi:lysozyme [Caulobacter ginsengisoli]|uniref:Lysozyme n=1 Tax=Caulobacter ginsengisoli TaxID=400775 RepID=A0ABU0IM97_9CAUL|nr:GH25 family lysozyme [Caulobacter ginsengisoli]MDQ0462525.1 lysozyme [Caulobacter ginsengisoli]